MNSGATLKVVGPVIVTLANGLTLDATAGSAIEPTWLTVGNASLSGTPRAPSSIVTLNGSATLCGRVECDRLTLNGNAAVVDPARRSGTPRVARQQWQLGS